MSDKDESRIVNFRLLAHLRRRLPSLLSAALAGALACVLPGADAHAAIVKSVQTSSPEETMPSTGAVKTVTLPRPVDSSRAFVVCSARSTNGNADRRVTCELSDTQLVITQGATDAAPSCSGTSRSSRAACRCSAACRPSRTVWLRRP